MRAYVDVNEDGGFEITFWQKNQQVEFWEVERLSVNTEFMYESPDRDGTVARITGVGPYEITFYTGTTLNDRYQVSWVFFSMAVVSLIKEG